MSLKAQIRDYVALMQQAVGLPHNRTRAQVNRLKAALLPEMIEQTRAEVIAAAYHLSAEQLRSMAGRYVFVKDRWQFTKEVGMSSEDQLSLALLVRVAQPKICVETGVERGTSSTVILTELADAGGGHLYSLDLASQGLIGELVPDALRPMWDLRLQTSQPLLPVLLSEIGRIDFFLHDSRHDVRHMMWEYELAWAHLRAGGCLSSHDVLTTTAFDDFRRRYADEIASWGVIRNFGFVVKR